MARDTKRGKGQAWTTKETCGKRNMNGRSKPDGISTDVRDHDERKVSNIGLRTGSAWHMAGNVIVIKATR